MKINVKVDGLDEILKRLDARAEVEAAARQGVAAFAEVAKAEVVRTIEQAPRSGPAYTRDGVTHHASAPGEPPASLSGELVKSLKVEPGPGGSVQIVSDSPHAVPLEFGTRHMRARPFLPNTVETVAKTKADLVTEPVKKALKAE